MKYFSMFTGIGGFDLALNNNGHFCVGYSEIDKYAIKTYEKNFGKDVKNYGDATRIKPEELPDFDLLVGGFPCQAFSLAGKQRGFEDTRGTLFYEIARIVKSKRPRYLLLENVKGLLSHDQGKTFRIIIETFRELGYTIDYGVLNSMYFGVPQRRERIFIIGSAREAPRLKVFPIGNIDTEIDGKYKSQNPQIRKKKWSSSTCPNYAITVTAQQREDSRTVNHIMVIDDYNHKIKDDNVVGAVRQTFGNSHNENGFKILATSAITTENAHSFRKNVTMNQAKDIMQLTGKIRRLTPLECERLQGFPDGWTEGVSDTQRYKQCGNAVTVNVIEAILKNMVIEE